MKVSNHVQMMVSLVAVTGAAHLSLVHQMDRRLGLIDFVLASVAIAWLSSFWLLCSSVAWATGDRASQIHRFRLDLGIGVAFCILSSLSLGAVFGFNPLDPQALESIADILLIPCLLWIGLSVVFLADSLWDTAVEGAPRCPSGDVDQTANASGLLPVTWTCLLSFLPWFFPWGLKVQLGAPFLCYLALLIPVAMWARRQSSCWCSLKLANSCLSLFCWLMGWVCLHGIFT